MSPFPTETRLAPIGIVLALYPSDPSLSIEIQRAPDSGGSPGTAETIAIVTPGTRTYTDLRSGGTWHYRSRHVRSGANASAWTAWVAATPVPIPTQLPQIPDVGGWIIKQGRLESTDGAIILDAPNEQIKMGAATSPTVGIGFFAGLDGTNPDKYDLRVGDPNGPQMWWDHSAELLKYSGLLEANGIRYGPLHISGERRNTTAVTTEQTLETFTVPAGAMGTTGGVSLRVIGQCTGNNDTKTVRVRFGGTVLASLVVPASTSIRFWRFDTYIFNDGATNSQEGNTFYDSNFDMTWVVNNTPSWQGTADTTAAVDIEVSIQLANSSDAGSLRMTLGELVAPGV